MSKMEFKLDLPKKPAMKTKNLSGKKESILAPVQEPKKRAKSLGVPPLKQIKLGEKLVKKAISLDLSLSKSNTATDSPTQKESNEIDSSNVPPFELGLDTPLPVTEKNHLDIQDSIRTKQIQINLDCETGQIKTKETWMLIMELLEDHLGIGPANIVREKDADYWWKAIKNLGTVSTHTLVKDRERLRLFIYACCFIHWHDLGYGSEAEDRTPTPILNPEFDPYVENVAQDGRHWGLRMERPDLPKTHVSPQERQAQREAPQSVDPLGHTFVDDGTLPNPFEEVKKTVISDVLAETRLGNRKVVPDPNNLVDEPLDPTPVRQQVEENEAKALEEFKRQQNKDAILSKREQAEDVYKKKWKIAEDLARKPKEAWQNAPFELVKMVEYCYGWLRDTGEVPYYPQDLVEIWWKRPTWHTTNMSPEAVQRRDSIVEKIRSFWTASVEQNKDKMNLRTDSYRATLAAMKLEKLIEQYANGADNENEIKGWALQYFHGHFPIETLGVKPGPIDTLDPDFIKYVQLCRKYNLEVGTYLHEANL